MYNEPQQLAVTLPHILFCIIGQHRNVRRFASSQLLFPSKSLVASRYILTASALLGMAAYIHTHPATTHPFQ